MHDLFEIGKKPKDAPALMADTGVEVTYGALEKQLEAFERILCVRSLAFCMCKNEPGAVVGYLGMLAAGCVPLLLAADLNEEQLLTFFETYRPAYIWAPEDESSERPPLYRAYGYELRSTGNAPYGMYADLALLLATSGSTGDPKLVRLSCKNLRANAASICTYLQLDASERPITTLPMQYTYGLSIINSHLLAGAAILMTTAGYVQSAFWEFFERAGATSFGGVPYTYEILKKIHLFQKKLPSLRSITQAGGKLSVSLQEEVARWAQAQGVRFYVMYGQTEATARMGCLLPEMCLKKPGSIGCAIPGGRFWLADENGREISESTEDTGSANGAKKAAMGELVYVGENVSLGYAVCAGDLQRGDERHGVLYTGDLAQRDADGYYYIVGRKKRFVKIFGVRVSLDACEETLQRWYPEMEIACAGSDDCLNIYISGGGSQGQRPEAETACEEAAGRLAEYLHLNRRAFRAICLDRIPKNDAGKVLYRKLPDLERNTYKEMKIKNGSTELYCRLRGQGPALMLIHGVACDADYFEEAAGILSRYFTVITYDRRGYSRSRGGNGEGFSAEDKAEDMGQFSVREQAGDAAAIWLRVRQILCQDSRPQKRKQTLFVVGSSAGCLVAAELACLYPELVGGLFLHEPVLGGNAQMKEEIRCLNENLRAAAEKKRVFQAMRIFIDAMGGIDPRAPKTPMGALAQNVENLKIFLYKEMDDFLTYDIAKLKTLTVPAQIVVGEDDGAGLFCRAAVSAAEALKWPLVRVPGCHNFPSDLPDAFARCVCAAAISSFGCDQ